MLAVPVPEPLPEPWDAPFDVPFAPALLPVPFAGALGLVPTDAFDVVVGRAEPPRAPEGRDAGGRAAGEVGRRAGTPRFCRAAPPSPGTVVGAPARTTLRGGTESPRGVVRISAR
ncbi:hypothetical protein GCM10027054_31830 [Isoptericola nanjingensis]